MLARRGFIDLAVGFEVSAPGSSGFPGRCTGCDSVPTTIRLNDDLHAELAATLHRNAVDCGSLVPRTRRTLLADRPLPSCRRRLAPHSRPSEIER